MQVEGKSYTCGPTSVLVRELFFNFTSWICKTREALISELGKLMTDQRKARMAEVLAQRTRYLTLVLENIYDPFNASACLRSCDCFGIHEVHIIENDHKFSASHGVSMGAHRWLDLHNHREKDFNTEDAFADLKAKGYRIVVTSPLQHAVPIHEIDLQAGPVAIVLGSEMNGASDRAFELADEIVTIPMLGFTESFNISVSAALCLSSLRERLNRSDIDWQLESADASEILHSWYRKSVRGWEEVEERYLKSV